MSVDSTELQRATLERKKADELAVIANALGVKPGSRAKKSDLVQMILDATSGGGSTAAASGGASTAATGGGAEGGPAVEPPSEPVVSAPAASAPVARASLFDTPSAAEARRLDEASGRDEARPAWRNEPGPAPADAPVHDRDADDRNARDRGVHDDAAADGRDDDAADDHGSAPGGGEGRGDEPGRFEGEGGGRRRRRRGRDRDRLRDEPRPGEPRTGEARPGEPRTGEPRNGEPRNGEARAERPREDYRGDRPDRADDSSVEPVAITGSLDLRDEGYGFLRINGSLPSRDDAYVSVRQVRQFGLRRGDMISGASRPAGHKEKNPALLRIDTVNGLDPELARNRPRFEDLTPLFPDERLVLEHRDDPYNMTARIIDLVSPIGKGQRGLIVSPPKAGKTTVMKQIARAIERNNPEVHLIVLLVDERPEEVTDMKRWLQRGEVAASTFDRPAEEHIQVAELTIERAKRLVEMGKDVCVILDGITRLARAYNLGAPVSGRIMSGGIDASALYPPKKFFGAARNVEEGGSLTILATALVETGSRMDEVIFEEFKGTGNMELKLDRRLAERRVFPAIDVDASSTRHEELLFDRKQLQQVWKLRRVLSGMRADGDGGAAAGLELLIDRLQSFRTNAEFLAEVAKG